MKALLLEDIHSSSQEAFDDAGIEVLRLPGSLAEDELVDAIRDVQVLGIRSNTRVTERVLEKAPHLEAIGCFCIGTNQVALDAAARMGIPVFNAPYSNSRSVVELVIGEIIALARRLPEKTERLHAGIWDKSAKGSHEVRGRTLGIIGYGNIGTQLANLAEALGLRVIFFDVADRPAHGNARRMPSMEALLAEADVVSLHVDGRPGNAGLFGAEQFAAMKPRALFINASRGMVVDDLALRDQLLSGHLAGAALDVFPIEPKAQGDEFESVLRGVPNVILTPHVGASTLEAQEEIGRFVAGKLTGFIRQGSTALSVNLPAVLPAAHVSGVRVGVLHENTRGVLGELNQVLSEAGNITAQSLATTGEIGYVVTDIDGLVDDSVLRTVRGFSSTRWVRAWKLPTA